jgi:hypothetical protein
MKRVFIASALCTAALLAGAAGAASGNPRHPIRIHTGKLQMDGVLTVGQPETIFVSKLLPKTKVALAVAPTPNTAGCSFPVFCFTETIHPTAGGRTTGKGRAAITFVVPSTYKIFNIKFPTQPQTGTFTNGQAAQVLVTTFRRRHRRIAGASVTGNAVMEVPPPPPAP